MKRVIGIIILNLVLLTYSYAGFSVVRPSFGLSLDKPKTREQLIINTGDRNLRVKIYAEKPMGLKDESLYMGEWIKVYPRFVTIPANGKKKVRFIARPPKNLEDGEYRCMLYYEEIRKEDEKQESRGFKLRVGTPIYGRSGDLTYTAEYSGLKFKKTEKGYTLSGMDENTGNTSYTLWAKINFFDKEERLLEEVNRKAAPLLRGTTRKIGLKLEEVEKASKVTILFYEKNQKHRYEKSFKL